MNRETLGGLIVRRRRELHLSRLRLSELCGVSHTEIMRIETGERELPSVTHLYALGDALDISREDMLKAAGCDPLADGLTPTQRAFPGLKREKQLQVMERIAEGLYRNGELKDEDLDGLCRQVEMFLKYAAENDER